MEVQEEIFISKSDVIGVRTGWGPGAAVPLPPSFEFFTQNAYDSGKSTWDKSFIKSGFYNTTKRFILKSFDGSAANPNRCEIKGRRHHGSKERGRSWCAKPLNKGSDGTAS